MFVVDGGVRLTSSRLSLDFAHRQPLGFVSHAHADHMARHEVAVCTSATGALYCHHLGKRHFRPADYGVAFELGGSRFETLPAGHMLGSAMLVAREPDGRSLLYTGDFQLAASRTAAPVEHLPSVDILIMESTFGQPRWTLPSVEEAEQQLVDWVEQAWEQDRNPVIFAYATGKAQEMIALLAERTSAQILQHPKIAGVTKVYRDCGVNLPAPEVYAGVAVERSVVLLPPRTHHASFLPCPARATKIGVTGWGLDPRTRHRLEVDHVAPLSDHADFPQLLELVERVSPDVVFCTHGSPEFVDHLRSRDVNAHVLEDAPRVLQQMRL